MRVVVAGDVEVRELDGKRKQFVGRPIKWGHWSDMIGGAFRERFLPGAFDEHLATKPDVIASIDHDARRLLGRTASSTLTLRSDREGLYIECDGPDTSYAADLAVSVKRGDIRGMSFIFEAAQGGDRWYTEDGERRRDVSKAKLYEVSFVVFPAYPTTEAAMRSLAMADWKVEVERRRSVLRMVESL